MSCRRFLCKIVEPIEKYSKECGDTAKCVSSKFIVSMWMHQKKSSPDSESDQEVDKSTMESELLEDGNENDNLVKEYDMQEKNDVDDSKDKETEANL